MASGPDGSFDAVALATTEVIAHKGGLEASQTVAVTDPPTASFADGFELGGLSGGAQTSP